MRGVVFVGERELEIREFPDLTPGPGEVIVAIKASGMCGSDLHSYREPKSVRTPDKQCIAGHEPCGVVAAFAGRLFAVEMSGRTGGPGRQGRGMPAIQETGARRSGTLNTVLFLAKGSLFREQTDAGYWPSRP
jgi:hypothetical protein